MTMLSHIVQGTPIWVFVLFLYLLWVGIRGLRPATMTLQRVWLVPAIFIVWGLYGLAQRPVPPEDVAAFWAIGAIAGGALGVLTSPRHFHVDRQRRLVRRPGSIAPLVRNLAIFFGHYVLNVAMAINPDDRHTLVLIDIVVSGVSTGYFAGWLFGFLRRYRAAPEMPFAEAAAPQSSN